MVSGTGYLCVEDSRYLLAQGQAAIIPMGKAHAGYFADHSGLVVDAVQLAPSVLSFPEEDDCQQQYLSPFLKGELCMPCALLGEADWERQALAHIRGIIEALRDRPAGYELMVKARFYSMFAGLLQAGAMQRSLPAQSGRRARVEKLKRVLTFLGEHYAEKLTVEQLAELAELSADHFYKFFKTYVRMPPMEYLNYLRVQKSLLLLSGRRELSVTDIALQVGFYDGSHFAKLFRKYLGQSPVQYRKDALLHPQKIGVAFTWDGQHGLLRCEP